MPIGTDYDDSRYRSRQITSWEMIHKPAPFGNPLKPLRIRVTYVSGQTKVLPPSFSDRTALERYVARFHPEFTGKEHLNP